MTRHPGGRATEVGEDAMSTHVARPYQVCLYVGPEAPTLQDVRVVDLTPETPTPEAVLDRLRASDLTPADLRARVLFVADGTTVEHRDAALLVYSALLGFAKRRLDAAFGVESEALVLADFDATVRRLPDAGKPADVLQVVQVGGPERSDLDRVDLADLSPATLTAVRYARRVRFVPAPALAVALPQLVALAAMRARGDNDKLPFLVHGDEPAPTEDTAADVVGICLNTLRRDAEDVRRSLRSDNREALAEKAELTGRQRRLLTASALPIEEVLVRLGARSKMIDVVPKVGDDGELGPTQIEVWHCPRPDRHRNGDATPSARITRGGKFQCFGMACDKERVDALRLVMDVQSVSADEAADWLLGAA